MSIALQRSRVSIGIVPLLLALVAAFVVGYSARDVTAPAATAAPSPISACATGSHPVVWYTAHAWACVSDTDPAGLQGDLP
jgi:hypothetical protein